MDVYAQSLANPLSMEQVFAGTTHRPGGFPGIALIDHDNDGDTDIYVTNGPNGANALFSNQLRETGMLMFADLSAISGADATDMDSNGVCFGDLDNDGDEDLYVLGRESGNRLYENTGGRFVELHGRGAEAGNLSHISCSMGDVDGDGLLDIAVSNVFDLSSALALVAVPYDLNHYNQLFRNGGGMRFVDVSDSSGIRRMALGGTTDPTPPTISWAVAMVDGNLDCNGTLDIFASNLGDYMGAAFGMPSALGDEATRWVLGHGDGTYTDPQAGFATAFGWGNAVADLDNDGDQDLLYHGAMDLNAVITHDNPGVVLENRDCSAQFTENLDAFRGDYTKRGTQGVAVGDLDQDGYVDVVTVSNHNVTDDIPFFVSPAQHGSNLDATARYYLPMLPDPTSGLVSWGGIETRPGDLTVELNNGSGNGSVSFRTVGGIDLVDGGRNNRSGIGAVGSFTPHRGKAVSVPVVGGSGFLSQHALDAHFGLGQAPWGTADVLWPGGVRNRLYGVRPGERLLLPEIPCSVGDGGGFLAYSRCVRQSVVRYQESHAISRRHGVRLGLSALIAYFDRH